MTRRVLFCCIVALLSTSACRERFEAEGIFKGGNFLVVEGFINVGDGITKIKLSHVTALNEPGELVSEDNALVFIEDDAGLTYALQHINTGVYESGELNLEEDHEYRLRIEVDNKIFLSAYSTPVITPRIDSVGWFRSDTDFIFIHVNTHDPLNETFYYKWEYEEVWEARSKYRSKWAYVNGMPQARSSDEITAMSFCWPYRRNNDLIIASSAQFSTDAISLFPLINFYITDPRLGWRYSITVTQRALRLEEYEFLQLMKKNSNDLGSFFDSQPSQLTGNITCVSSDEPVVGYIGAYTSQRKQLILKRSIISDFTYTIPCAYNNAPAYFSDPLFTDYLSLWTPIEPIYGEAEDDAAPIIGFLLGRTYCVDCRVGGGTAPKPDFWVKEDEEEVE